MPSEVAKRCEGVCEKYHRQRTDEIVGFVWSVLKSCRRELAKNQSQCGRRVRLLTYALANRTRAGVNMAISVGVTVDLQNIGDCLWLRPFLIHRTH